MQGNVQLISTTIVLAGLALCAAAHADDPASLQVAPGNASQAKTGGSGAAPTNPSREGSPLGFDVNPSKNTPSDTSLVSPPEPTSQVPDFGFFPKTGKTLLDAGIDIHGFFLDQFLANPTFGVAPRHTTNLGIFNPRVDFDLGKLVGINGGFIHVGETVFLFKSDIYPNGLFQFGGVLNAYQTLPAPVNNTLNILTYEQDFLNGRLSFEVGRTSIYNYFQLPNALDILNQFSTTFFLTADVPPPPYPTWGGRATYKFTPTWYVQAGAFADNTIRAYLQPYVLTDSGAAGAQVLGEVAYRSEFSNARYPANLEVGGEYNTRHGGYFNLRGSPIAATPFTQATNYTGGAVIYALGQQVIVRGPDRRGFQPANIAVYGSLDVSADKPQPIDLDAMIGVNFTGILPLQRPYDALGVQVRYQRLSAIEANFETFAEGLVNGPGPKQPRDSFGFQIVSDIGVAPFAKLSPSVEYFVNPDEDTNPLQVHRAKDGFAFGLTLSVSIGRLLGTSEKPF